MPKKKPETRQPTLDDLISGGYRYVELDQPPQEADVQPKKSSLARRALGDTGIALTKGAIGVPESLVGIADLVTGGEVGRMAEQAGFRPKEARAILDQYLSPEQQAANAAVQQADGFTGKLGAAVTNPSVIWQGAVESAPSMLAGGAVARGAMAVAPRIPGVVAAGLGEGAISAGQTAEQVRQETADGTLIGKQAVIAAGSGALTGVLSMIAGRVAQKLGIGDVDSLVAGVQTASPKVQKGVIRSVLEGAVSEGVLDELPQSVQEQVAQNMALGKPLEDGVDHAAVLGMLSGGLMGGVAGPLAATGTPQGKAIRDEKLPEIGPFTRALNANTERRAADVDAGKPTMTADQATLEAQNRAAELDQKAHGTEDTTHLGPDGTDVTIPGTPAQHLTEAERHEREHLAENADNPEALAHAQGATISPLMRQPESAIPGALPAETALARVEDIARRQEQVDRAIARAAVATEQVSKPAPVPTPTPTPSADDASPDPELTDILSPAGDPFKNKAAVNRAHKRQANPADFVVASVAGGYVLRPVKKEATDVGMALPVEPGLAGSSGVEPADGGRGVAADGRPAAESDGGIPEGTAAAVAPARDAGVASGDDGAAVAEGWQHFATETGTRNVPRSDMPQIRAEHRGAMTQFLKGRDITHEQEQDVDPATLKPTQAEFSPEKVQKAREFTEGDRAILVSSDGHVLDGHHQWLAALEDGKPIRTIRLNAPIEQLLTEVKEFPSATTSDASTPDDASQSPAAGAETAAPAAEASTATPSDAGAEGAASVPDAGPAAVQAAGVEPAQRWDAMPATDRAPLIERAGWDAKKQVTVTKRLLKAPWDKLSESQRARIGAAMGQENAEVQVPQPAADARTAAESAAEAPTEQPAQSQAGAPVEGPGESRATTAPTSPADGSAQTSKAGAKSETQPAKIEDVGEAGSGEVLFSRSPDTKATYEARINALFAGDKPKPQGVRILDRSDVLAMLGMNDGPVHLVESKVEQGRFNHGLTAADWKSVPQWLETPAAVFDSDTQPGRLVFIGPALVRGSPVRMIIDPRPDGHGVNLLINAYDAERNPFVRWARDGLLRYVDRTKAAPAPESFLPRLTGLPGERAPVRILTEKNLAGYRRSQASFSRGAQEKGADADRLQQFADTIAESWANAPPVVVVESMQDQRVPQEARDADDAQRSQGATGEPEGFFYKGKVYLVASAIEGDAGALRVLMHEALGHYGLRGVYGRELGKILDRLAQLNHGKVRTKAREYGLDFDKQSERRQAAEEVLAEMAQDHPELGWVKRAIAAIRSWLREHVPGFGAMKFSDAEIISNFILPARAWVKGGEQMTFQRQPVPAFKRDAATFSRTDADAFKRWFGDSKVVDDQGKPLVVYHGSTADIEAFDPSKSPIGNRALYFTSRRELADVYAKDAGVVYPVFLSMQNPLVLDGSRRLAGNSIPGRIARMLFPQRFVAGETHSLTESLSDKNAGRFFTQEDVDKLRAAGYDGVMAMNRYPGDDSQVMVVFSPEQIKSAIGNRGTFDPENPDVRFSRASDAMEAAKELTLPAGYKVRDFMEKHGNLSWWHKSVGTMHNLAEHSPAFKKVYDSVQSFINDVSLHATKAADLAPNILPRLEHWKDILKSPLSAQDTKAIAAPIFEGTLTWGRDENGKPVKMTVLEEAAQGMDLDEKAHQMLRAGLIAPKVLQMWQGLPIEQYEQIINGKYEREMLKPGVVWEDSELRSIFNLNDKQIGLYREFRAATDKSLTDLAISDMVRFAGKDAEAVRAQALAAGDIDQTAELVRDYLFQQAKQNPDRAEVLNDTGNKVIEKADRAKDLMKRGYAPLSRFGQYTLDVLDEAGERVYFGLFESEAEANKMARRMRDNFSGAKIAQGTVSQEEYRMFAGVSPETLELFGEMLGLESQGDDAKSLAFQTYLKRAKNNRSAMKRLIERKGIAGFSEDSGRVLAGFLYSNARQTSTSLHMGQIDDAVNEINKDATRGQGELKDAAVQLREYIKNPQEEAQAIRGLLFAQFIGGSVASAMVNLLQPMQVTFPYLTQYGGVRKAASRMASAVRDAGKRSTGDAALDAALKKAEEEGVVSPQEVHQLMAQAGGKAALKSGDGTTAGNAAAKTSNALSKLALAWGKFFSMAEQINRRVTFIAAYRTAVEQGIDNPAEFAAKTIADTQFTYNKGSKAKWARGAVGGTLFTFKSYSVNYVEVLHRMWTQGGPEGKKAALLALAVLFLMSGMNGLPFEDDLEDVIDGALQRMGYNFSSKQAKREFLARHLGQGGADFVTRGLSGLPGAPIDVSGRLGLGNLIPGTGLLTKKQGYGNDVAELLGPAGSLAKRIGQAAGQAFDGNVMKAAGTVSPLATQNLLKAYDMASTGMYKDAKGGKVIDVDGYDAMAKAIGFQPNDVARVQDAAQRAQEIKSLNQIRQQEISEQWAQGVFEKDAAKVDEARAALRRWNENNPDTPIHIKITDIRRRLVKMRQSKAERLASTAPKQIRQTVRRELESQ